MPPDARRDLQRIFSAAIAGVDPTRLVRERLSAFAGGGWDGRVVLVVGAGKAAARMAAGCEEALGTTRTRGLVIVPDGCETSLGSVQIALAGHPIPDRRGVQATAALCRLLRTAKRGPVLCLISGGASSLLVRPRRPVTLADKMDTNRLLLQSGADIAAINTVRKHLSTVKGGGLLRAATGRPLVTFVLSDVVGDDPCVIGSGPTVPDPTTFAEAREALRRVGLLERVPPPVRALLDQGIRGAVPETVKPGDRLVDGAVTELIGTNRMALEAAAAEARRLGYRPIVQASPLVGDTSVSAREWLSGIVAEAGRQPAAPAAPWCAIAGGETTVVVKGPGRGGRNQEFALTLVDRLAGMPIAVLSAGTDGVDGPTDAAGAFVDGTTLDRSRVAGLDPDTALQRNDSYAFFDRLGDLLRCGPTGTNVMDIKLALGPLPRVGPPW